MLYTQPAILVLLMAASQLVTQSTRHRSTRHPVDLSQGGDQLVTSKHQSRTANNVLVPPTSWP